MDQIHPKRGGSDQSRDLELQVWSHVSATEMLYEEGKEDTDCF